MEDKENQTKLAILNKEIQEIASFKDNLLDIYLSELEENIFLVLKLKEEFLNYLLEKITFAISDLYSTDVFSYSNFLIINDEIKNLFITNYYNPIYEFLLENIENEYFHINKRRAVYRKNNININYSETNEKSKNLDYQNFIKHCPKTEDIALHSCKKELNFIKFSKNELEFEFLYCKFCYEVYFASYVKLFCKPCQEIYISSNFPNKNLFSITSNNSKDSQPESFKNDGNLNAHLTYQKYHTCQSFYWEPIKCLECNGKNKLIYNFEKKKIYCEGCPSLKFTDEKNELLESLYDNCCFCNEEFKGKLKIYNGLEKRDLQFAIKNALISKEKINNIPLNSTISNSCVELIKKEQLNFFHDLKCNGILYSAEYNFKKIIICSKCRSVTDHDKYNWLCPICKTQICSKKEENSNLKNNIKQNSNSSIEKDNIETDIGIRKRYFTGYQKAIPDMKNFKNLALLDIKNLKSNFKNFKINEINNNNTKDSNLEKRIIFKSKGNNISFNNNVEDEQNNNKSNIKYDLNDHIEKSPLRIRNFIQYKKNENISLLENLLKTPKILASKISVKLNSEKNIDNNSGYNQKENKIELDKISSINTPKSTNKVNFFLENLNFKQMILNDPINAKNFIKENNILNFVQGLQAENSPLTSRSKNNKITMNNNIINIDINENNSNSANISNKNIINPNNNITNIKTISSNNLIKIQKNEELEKNNKNINESKSKKKVSYKLDALNEQKEANPCDSEQIKNLYNKKKLMPRMSEIRINEALGEFDYQDYKIISKIGEGSFGQIYHVEDKLKRSYCMKKIVSSDLKDLNAFAQEYELVNKIKHDNVLRIYSICRRKLDSTTYVLYILMEKAITDWDKEIRARATQTKYYSEDDLLIILKQCVEGLSFLQENSISHRDIKPQNILLFKDGIFKMADFGEAKKIKNSQINKELNTLRGTELYMSPILLNSLNKNYSDVKHNSYKSDVFSLGFCFLYAASLNLNNLFDLRNVYDSNVMSQGIKKVLKPLYSELFIDIIQLMLEIKEDNRYDFIKLKKLLEKNNI